MGIIEVESEDFGIPSSLCPYLFTGTAYIAINDDNLYTNYCDNSYNLDTNEPSRCMKKYCPIIFNNNLEKLKTVMKK